MYCTKENARRQRCGVIRLSLSRGGQVFGAFSACLFVFVLCKAILGLYHLGLSLRMSNLWSVLTLPLGSCLVRVQLDFPSSLSSVCWVTDWWLNAEALFLARPCSTRTKRCSTHGTIITTSSPGRHWLRVDSLPARLWLAIHWNHHYSSCSVNFMLIFVQVERRVCNIPSWLLPGHSKTRSRNEFLASTIKCTYNLSSNEWVSVHISMIKDYAWKATHFDTFLSWIMLVPKKNNVCRNATISTIWCNLVIRNVAWIAETTM